MRPDELYREEPVGRAKGQIREGLRYVWSTPVLRNILAITAIVGTLAINFPVVLPLVAERTFHGNAATYSWMTVGMGVGALVGALWIASRVETTAKQVLVCCLGFGVAICVASAAPTLALFLFVMLFMGAGQITVLASCNSTLQLRSDPVLRGRVMGVYMITLLGSTPIGGPIVGWVSQHFGPRWGLAVGGVATLFTALTFGVALYRADRRKPAGARVPGIADEVLRVGAPTVVSSASR
jgi:predicted MFS family arabinose efflux permease